MGCECTQQVSKVKHSIMIAQGMVPKERRFFILGFRLAGTDRVDLFATKDEFSLGIEPIDDGVTHDLQLLLRQLLAPPNLLK